MLWVNTSSTRRRRGERAGVWSAKAARIRRAAERDRRLDQTDELIRFVGELNRRSEIVFQSVVRELREMRRETRASTREILARAADNSELMKAHAEAIFALIDRLEGGSGGVAPAT